MEFKEWSVKDLTEKFKNKKEIKIPLFQRTFVWDQDQKDSFINSLKRGYPIGMILLFRNKDDNSYQLIDGLQRSSTIVENYNNLGNFFKDENIEDQAITNIFNELGLKSKEEKKTKIRINEILKNWITSQGKNTSFQYIDFAERLSKEYTQLDEIKQNRIAKIIKPMMDSFLDEYKIFSDLKIPVSIFEGDSSNLPNIFMRINKQGTKLTKHQIFAATWTQNKIKITDERLLPIIRYTTEKYLLFKQRGYDLSGFDLSELQEEKTVEIFDLVFSFGKMLSANYPDLFKKSELSDDIPEFAFTLLNYCLRVHDKNLDSLHTNIIEIAGGPDKSKQSENINKFLVNVLDTIDYVDKTLLKNLHKFKLNSKSLDNISKLHTDYQITSIIASIFLMRHSNVLENKQSFAMNLKDPIILNLDSVNADWEKEKLDFERNTFKFYIRDIISKEWKSSGDNRAFDIVKSPGFYSKEMKWEDFELHLNIHFNNQLSERFERTVDDVLSPSDADKIILKMIYTHKFSASHQINQQNRFQIEHLATKKGMEDIMSKHPNLMLPISSLGNLSVLPELINIKKGKKALFENEELLVQDLKLVNMELSELSDFAIVSKSDMEWFNNKDADEEFIRSEYISFIKMRFNRIKSYIKLNYFN